MPVTNPRVPSMGSITQVSPLPGLKAELLPEQAVFRPGLLQAFADNPLHGAIRFGDGVIAPAVFPVAALVVNLRAGTEEGQRRCTRLLCRIQSQGQVRAPLVRGDLYSFRISQHRPVTRIVIQALSPMPPAVPQIPPSATPSTRKSRRHANPAVRGMRREARATATPAATDRHNLFPGASRR